jgi:hypothetical protein
MRMGRGQVVDRGVFAALLLRHATFAAHYMDLSRGHALVRLYGLCFVFLSDADFV